MISAVLFDLDETLLDRTTSLLAFLADQHARFGAQLGTASFEAWRDRFLSLDARGHVHKSVVYPKLLASSGGDPSCAHALLADYRERCCRFARPFAGMAETLERLQARGVRLGIVTNGETDFQTRHIEALGLDRLFDAVLISQAEGLRKPDAALFQRAARRLGVEPGQCLFVGDNPQTDVLGAHAVGMQAVWFRAGQTWPSEIPAPPGKVIDHLPDIIGIVEAASV